MSSSEGQLAHDFLARILPEHGYRCALVKGKHNQFFPTTQALADFILLQSGLGETVYHACASFKVPHNDDRAVPRAERVLGRTKKNALAARAFWLDVDCGAGKPYPDAEAGFHAVDSFCRSTGLPTPIYVGSGMGLHVYWPLDQDLDRETWERYATHLRSLCERHSLAADPTRTADISSILRTPGSHWRKHGAVRIVQCGELVGPYNINELGELSDVGATRTTVHLPQASLGGPSLGLPAGAQRIGRPASLAAAALNVYGENVPPDAHKIAEQCGQLREMAASRGNLPEPTWYAALGVLAHCADGERLAHEWSGGHPQYSARETTERFSRAGEWGPTTCAKFAAINAAGCSGCPFAEKITSPIQLGRHRGHSAGSPSTATGNFGRPVEDQSVGLAGQAVSAAPGATDFRFKGEALYHVAEGNKGEDIEQLVSMHAPKLARVQTGEIEDNAYSLVFDFKLPRSGRREIMVPAGSFFSAAGISEISRQGGVIHETELYKKYVREAIDNWHQMNNLSKQYDQFGWKDDDTSFLFGRNLYTAQGVTPMLGSPELNHRGQFLGPSSSGSLSRWTSAANGLFARGLEPHSFALLCSFAAPLMRFHAAGEGGAIVSLVSDQSGSGKTTALEAVASVWGRLKGTQLTDEDTKVAKGLKLGLIGNLACTYDELHNRDPEVVRQFVLMFTSGHDKDRGTSNGQLIHTKAEWQTILAVASNQSIVDILSNMDGTDAPAFRVLEFNTTLPDSADTKRGDAIRRELQANAGHAGDAYLRYLLQPDVLNYVKSALPQWTDQIWQRTGLKPEHRFWVRTIASVIAAGTIVQKLGIIDFSVQRIADWVCEQVSERKAEATVTGQRNDTQMLSEYINEHLQDMLVMPHAWKPKTVIRPTVTPKGKLHMRYELAEGRLFALENHLRKWLLKKGVHRKVFVDSLRERGVIVHDKKRVTLGAGSDYASGQVTAVEIDMNHPAMSGMVLDVEKMVQQERIA